MKQPSVAPPARHARPRILAIALGAAFAIACNRGPHASPLCDAVAFYATPDDSVIVVREASGALHRVDADGKPLGGAFECDAAQCDVVVTASGDALVIRQRANPTEAGGADTVQRWKRDGKAEALPAVAQAHAGPIRPCLNGTASNGSLAANVLALLAFHRSGALEDVLRLDVTTGEVAPWPGLAATLAEFAGDARSPPLVSIAPDCETLALFTEHAGRKELRLFAADGALLKTIDGAEPVKPYWLANLRALMFVRTGGSVASLLLPKGEPVWLVNGSFTSGISRAEVTSPIADNPRVTVEKTNFEGFVQVFELAPFEAGDARERQLTSGNMDHFGAAWSHDHRYLAFRQRVLADAPRSAEERIVVIDTASGFHAEVVAKRECEVTSDHIGPYFMASRDRLLLIENGKLCRIDLSDESR